MDASSLCGDPDPQSAETAVARNEQRAQSNPPGDRSFRRSKLSWLSIDQTRIRFLPFDRWAILAYSSSSIRTL
jgi:hypothetical protein